MYGWNRLTVSMPGFVVLPHLHRHRVVNGTPDSSERRWSCTLSSRLSWTLMAILLGMEVFTSVVFHLRKPMSISA